VVWVWVWVDGWGYEVKRVAVTYPNIAKLPPFRIFGVDSSQSLAEECVSFASVHCPERPHRCAITCHEEVCQILAHCTHSGRITKGAHCEACFQQGLPCSSSVSGCLVSLGVLSRAIFSRFFPSLFSARPSLSRPSSFFRPSVSFFRRCLSRFSLCRLGSCSDCRSP
jgi:hypothetical protein